jgi:hypothetical protein
MAQPKRGHETQQADQGARVDDAKADEVGADQVKSELDEDRERGYRGTVPEGPPNEAYSLESGPDSPSAIEAVAAARKADLDALTPDDKK